MNNNQNYGQQPQQGQQPRGQQINPQWQQPQQGYQQQQPQGQWQQPPQGFQGQQQYGQWQQPPKKGMSTGCIVGLIIGIIILLMVVVGGIVVILMGAAVFNSVQSEFDDIGSEFYNTAFELYLGEEKPARSVTSLMASVRANNEDEEETNKIKVEIELSDGTTMDYNSYDSDRIPKDSNYFIEAEKNSKGYISEIYIEEL